MAVDTFAETESSQIQNVREKEVVKKIHQFLFSLANLRRNVDEIAGEHPLPEMIENSFQELQRRRKSLLRQRDDSAAHFTYNALKTTEDLAGKVLGSRIARRI